MYRYFNKFRFILLFSEKESEQAHYELNSRIIGSLVTPSASGQELDVRVTLEHVKVSAPLWVGK